MPQLELTRGRDKWGFVRRHKGIDPWSTDAALSNLNVMRIQINRFLNHYVRSASLFRFPEGREDPQALLCEIVRSRNLSIFLAPISSCGEAVWRTERILTVKTPVTGASFSLPVAVNISQIFLRWCHGVGSQRLPFGRKEASHGFSHERIAARRSCGRQVISIFNMCASIQELTMKVKPSIYLTPTPHWPSGCASTMPRHRRNFC